MTEEKVAEVARGLTAEQADALMRAELDGNLGRWFTRWLSVPIGRWLVKAGLGTAVWSGVMLSALGEQVRAFLLAQPNQGKEREDG